MTLGRFDAAISPSFIEGLTLEGPVGHTGIMILDFIAYSILACISAAVSSFFLLPDFDAARKVAYLLRLPTDEHRLKVGISWLTKAAVESTALLQDTLTKMISMS